MRTDLYSTVFRWYVEAGKELTISELVLRSKKDKGVRTLTRANARLIAKKTKKVYANRWHEIYDTRLGIVHEPAPAPVQAPAPEPAPELEPEVDPLEALRVARASREEEHE